MKAVVRSKGETKRWCREFEEACRARGVRVTHQRLAVYRELAQDLTHPTAETLHGRLRPALPSLSLATVYRVLESLARRGLVRRVNTPDGAARFDANVHPHQHLACTVCGRLTDVEDAALARIPLPRLEVKDFVVRSVDIRIEGTCRRCLEAGDSDRTRRTGH